MHLLLAETIALIGATVHTMEPGPVPGGVVAAAPATVLIEDGLIVAVGPNLEIPEEAERIELTGLHLVPGLIDGFCTLDPGHDALWLASGVTTVRDGGMTIKESLFERPLASRDVNPGPQLLVSSPFFMDARSPQPDGFGLGAPEQAAEQIAEVLSLLKEGNGAFDYFRHDGSLDEGQLRVVCQAGLEYGVKTWGRIPRAVGIRKARAAGQEGLLGLETLLPKGARFADLDEQQQAHLSAAVADLAEGGWMVTPLLMGTGRFVRWSGSEVPPVLEALGPLYETRWRADLEAFQLMRSGNWDAVLRTVEAERRLVRQLHEAGVQLVPGSGAPSGGIGPGGGLIDELEEWVAAGIPAAEVLALATRGAAEAVGGDVPAGKVAVGHQANLLALSSDPRRSISALRTPEVMVLRGKVREGFELEDAVTALIEAQNRARAERARPIQLEPPPMPPGEVIASGVLELKLYGERYAVERYAVTRIAQGRIAYGARIRIPGGPNAPDREANLVQVIHNGLVEFVDYTIDVLDEAAVPQRKDGQSAFYARARPVGATRKLAVERLSYGQVLGSSRAEEPIAAVDGSMALLGLIAAHHFPEGPSYVLEFEGGAMEPMVDRLNLTVDPALHRLDLASQRSITTFGVDANSDVLFAARATTRGRINGDPIGEARAEGDPVYPVIAERAYLGDPATWVEDAAPRAASAPIPRGEGK